MYMSKKPNNNHEALLQRMKEIEQRVGKIRWGFTIEYKVIKEFKLLYMLLTMPRFGRYTAWGLDTTVCAKCPNQSCTQRKRNMVLETDDYQEYILVSHLCTPENIALINELRELVHEYAALLNKTEGFDPFLDIPRHLPNHHESYYKAWIEYMGCEKMKIDWTDEEKAYIRANRMAIDIDWGCLKILHERRQHYVRERIAILQSNQQEQQK